ncbi:Serine/threonine-protein kinase Nek9 [Acropora cervicornis]|uniref:non-specific serine/threonine protein kinase n=1 Tax=Acropora cervicornis TaxID=6130 RepID=A0AAD9QJ41_ACRCE|nr:Serine/threonine-protein kinase Nek9 [Acropora cervicornis]
MWALGCVLYEMLTLKKVFDATNPLRLVSDIVKGQFTDISPRYTAEMNSLVNVLLSQNPDDRPSIDAVLAMPLLSNLGREMEKKVWELNASTRRTRLVTSSSIDAVPVITSKTSDVFYWGGGKQTPQKVDMFQGGHSALQIAHGGKRMVGQLGHGDTATYRIPKPIEELHGIPIKQVACGDEITACITVSKEVYSWGCGEYGRLGQGSEDDCAAPQKVNIPTQCKVLAVCCGTDFTFLLTTAGRLLGFGNNEENQLGMNTPQSLRKRQIKSTTGHLPYVTSPKPVMSFNKYSISSVAAGRSHSAVIDDNQIYSWGRGDNGRLGVLTDSLMRAKGGIPCTAVPRPIFGALHILSCIACTHWNSIIIAERVLSSRTVKRGGAQGRSLESQSSGDNAPDSEFLDPIRLDTNQDSDNLFGDLTKDSGVGRSPRAPGFGSDPRSQEESSMPPAWLQDELDQAEYISMGSVGSESSERSLSGSGQTLSSSESSVPGWLKNELRDAEYIPIGGLTPPAGRDSKYETSTSSVAVQCDLEPRDVEDMKTLLLQVQQENAKLRETLAQQNKEMKILQQENNNFVVNQRKFWELIDSWHKDCQQAMPLGLADPREDGNVGRLGSAGARSSTDSFDDAWEV